MKHNSKIFVLLFIVVFAAVAFVFSASAEVYSGHIEYTYNDATIVNNDWTLDSETGLLTIKSIPSDNWNECGTGSSSSFDKYGGWSKYKLLIKKVVLVGNFSKISHNAFSGCTNLTEVVMTENVVQIDAGAFKGCSSLTTISVDSYVRIEGMADIRNVSVLNKSILEGT